MPKERVVLAYSGGLDTSVILHWLVYQKNYDVIAYSSSIGQQVFDENLVKKRAKESGATEIVIEDLKRALAVDYAFKALNADAIYEDGYMLGTAIARPLIASGQVSIAKKRGCTALSHGSTGKGNDQVRFELAYKALMPEAKILSPWKDPVFLKQFSNRRDLLSYAEKNGISVSSLSKSYSMDDNLLHISHEGGVLEDVGNSSYPLLIKESKANQSKELKVEFKAGIPSSLVFEDKKISDPVKMFQLLNNLSHEYCFGIADIVENRYVGIKSRGVYYQGAMELFYKAHVALEATILDKKTFHHKLTLGREAGKLIYEGKWFSKYLQSLFNYSEMVNKSLDGEVGIIIRPNSFSVVSRKPRDQKLYAKLKDFGSFSMVNFQPVDSTGFINIASIEDLW